MSYESRTCSECGQKVVAKTDMTLGQLMLYHLMNKHPEEYEENIRPGLESAMEKISEAQEIVEENDV